MSLWAAAPVRGRRWLQPRERQRGASSWLSLVDAPSLAATGSFANGTVLRWIAPMKRVFIVRNGHQRRRREHLKAKLVLGSMQGIGFCGIVCAGQACSARLQKPPAAGERPVPAPGSWAFSFAKAKLSARDSVRRARSLQRDTLFEELVERR